MRDEYMDARFRGCACGVLPMSVFWTGRGLLRLRMRMRTPDERWKVLDQLPTLPRRRRLPAIALGGLATLTALHSRRERSGRRTAAKQQFALPLSMNFGKALNAQ